MNSVGVDVSKGKSMIAVMRPFKETVFSDNFQELPLAEENSSV